MKAAQVKPIGRLRALGWAALTLVLLAALLLLGCTGPAGTSLSPTATGFTFALAVDQRNFAGPEYDSDAYFAGAIKAIAAAGGADFVVSPGDVDPPANVKWTLDKYLPGVPWFPGVGNHEAETPEDMAYMRAYAYDPGGPGSGPDVVRWGPTGCPTTTYSFDYLNAHFAMLNEYCAENGDDITEGDVGDHLYAWLAADLAASDKQFKFVLGHEPAYPQPDQDLGGFNHLGNSLDANLANRDRFWSLLQREGVVAYITGHTHRHSVVQIAGVWQVDGGHARGLGDPGAPSTVVLIHVGDDTVTFDAYRDVMLAPYDYRDIVHHGTLAAPRNGSRWAPIWTQW